MPLELIVTHFASDAELAALLAVPRIHALRLMGRAAGLPAIGRLGQRTDLRGLWIERMSAGPEVALPFDQITPLAGLKRLMLERWPSLADADLAPLASLTRLVRLELRDCPGVTDEGVAWLRRALPGAEVVRG